MKIYYGIISDKYDVTTICYNLLKVNNSIIIPSGDYDRSYYFKDRHINVLKKIFIDINGTETIYSDAVEIHINVITNEIKVYNEEKLLENIHNKLKLDFGSFNDEVPEQQMVVKFFKGHEKVLEIGGNIGRNSLVIATIVNNNNFVTLESDKKIANQLKHNRDINNMTFKIEDKALSKQKLIQKGWDTIPSDVLLNGYFLIDTITWQELNNKYNIPFDTLVLDCEGAFYYILKDTPEILNNIKMIIMENDYHNLEHKIYVDNVLKANGFYVIYKRGGGWGPCKDNFFEVWNK